MKETIKCDFYSADGLSLLDQETEFPPRRILERIFIRPPSMEWGPPSEKEIIKQVYFTRKYELTRFDEKKAEYIEVVE